MVPVAETTGNRYHFLVGADTPPRVPLTAPILFATHFQRPRDTKSKGPHQLQLLGNFSSPRKQLE
jgi:hypothetical protein